MKRLKFLKIRLSSIFSLGLMLLSCCLVVVIHPVLASDRSPASLPLTPATGEPGPQPLSEAVRLVTAGKQHYDAGQFREAAQLWQRSAQLYQSQGDGLQQALSLSYLALAYQELGDWPPAQQAIASSLKLLRQTAAREPSKTLVEAQVLNTQGGLQLALGQSETALETWKTAEQLYLRAKDIPGQLGSRINQAQALQSLGKYRLARRLLEQVRQQLKGQPPSALKLAGFQNLGTVWQATGDLESSQAVLQESLAIARHLNLPAEVSATLLNLANSARALKDSGTALQLYQQATESAPTLTARLQAQVNHLSLLIETEQETAARALVSQIQTQFNPLPISRSGIYIRVNWAIQAMRGRGHWPAWQTLSPQMIGAELAMAVRQAQQLQDSRAESLALGHLGALYEQMQQWREAENLTQKALVLALKVDARDIAYRWHWQLGRIQARRGDRKAAIAAYSEAIRLLKGLQRELVAMSPDLQVSFKEAVEPVYRELVGLLVQADSFNQQDLQQARQTIEGLQRAEIENFIRSACLEVQLDEVGKVDSGAAIFYPIILLDRLTVIFALPGQPLQVHTIQQPKQKIEATLEQFLGSLNPLVSDQERLSLSQQLYDWLIRPAEPSLVANQIKTLVFVLDGSLRNIPIAALHDGQGYLLEKYGVAITPSLQLLGPQAAPAKQNFQALIGALTEPRHGFPALPGVTVETETISRQMVSTVLLNQNFTETDLRHDLQADESSIVHLATHGQFSSNLDKTFILTWDQQLSIDALRELLLSRVANNRPIDLLVLSACQTAEGDQRAALGLAGMAVRSGARSTLGSLWAVNDQSTTELMVRFYRFLIQNHLSKAEALRRSQLELLQHSEYQHPYYWAPFVLIGNWL